MAVAFSGSGREVPTSGELAFSGLHRSLDMADVDLSSRTSRIALGL